MTGRLPAFAYGVRRFRDVPVLCFHSAHRAELEPLLEAMAARGMRSLDSAELQARLDDPGYRNDGTEIVLTFDDGMASVWSVLFPLLQRFEQKIILFVLPALTPDADAPRASMPGAQGAEAGPFEALDQGGQPFCTWPELERMAASGLVDVQSHGMRHERVPVSSRVVDFVHPGQSSFGYCNTRLPVYDSDTASGLREPVLGDPIYESLPRLAAAQRFVDPWPVRAACRNQVQADGGRAFFERPGWRQRLEAVVAAQRADSPGDFEHPDDRRHVLSEEFSGSRRAIEDRLGKPVRHFCFPWFAASEHALAAAAEAGYRAVHIGALPGAWRGVCDRLGLRLVTRVQADYAPLLAGGSALGLAGLWWRRIRTRAERSGG